jgi:hypothetical protein
VKQMILKNPKEAIKLVKSDAYYDKYSICIFCLLHDVLKPNQIYDFVFGAAYVGAFDENKNVQNINCIRILVEIMFGFQMLGEIFDLLISHGI